MHPNVILAIFKRNLVSYFSNPTGYVFICVFVLLSGFAAFWPNEFFNAGLANLDQLNRYFPYIMLVFIPAITMSIWAEERRQGTDELLLTIPAADIDVVLGKYLAAVAIFSISLLFSVSNVFVLSFLGDPDPGLMLTTFFGYWLIGLAMLAIGMTASFLTGNLTVGFILGCFFNLPLAFASQADLMGGLMGMNAALAIKNWSLSEQFRDFGRGVVSLEGVAYFLLVAGTMLYLSMVLIGRRHWLGGRDGRSLIGHYVLRVAALAGITIGVLTLVSRFSPRIDLSSEQLSALSPKTKELIRGLDIQGPVRVDAYVSPSVPESFVQTRLNLLTTLREFAALSGGKVQVRVHNTEQFSDEAERAEQQFGIRGQQVASRTRGATSVEQIYLGVAFTHGLNKVVVPFFDRGIPVEYELARSIATVAQSQRKRIGVLATDAKLYGGFDMQRMTTSPNEQIIDELEKQYEVTQVNADAPITDRFDVLLAVQPSSLTQQQMDNFIACVRSGQPTAIFEDPFPFFDPSVPGTGSPKMPQGNPFMGQQPPQPKGDITALWNLLGVDYMGDHVVWQNYNPYKKIGQFNEMKEFVFIDAGSGQDRPFDEANAISSKLQQLLLVFPGSVRQKSASDLKFETLVRTGRDTGDVAVAEILEPSFFGRGQAFNQSRYRRPTRDEYVLAAQISGKPRTQTLEMSDEGAVADVEPAADVEPEGDPPATGEGGDADEAAARAPREGINVVLVTDIDVLYSAFFALRTRGDDPEFDVTLNLDNVTFVLNVLDVLAGDERFVEIRKRRPLHRTLMWVEDTTAVAKEEANRQREAFIKRFRDQRDREQMELDKKLQALRERTDMDEQEKILALQQMEEVGRTRLENATERFKKDRDTQIARIERELSGKIRRVQDNVKMAAVALPPILPLGLGVFVFFRRRAQEREGVAKSRLR